MQGRADHYFRNSRSRRTEDDIDIDLEQPAKVSTHIQPHKKDHPFGMQRKHQESSQNSRLKDSRTGSGFGSVLGSRVGRVLRVSKNEKDKNVVTDIEFNNVRWISIVSAYDAKRLRHVTVSKQSCEQFLKKYGYGMKKDPTAMAYFKDIKKHFYSWLSKVNQTFVTVLSHFLTGSEKSPLSQLQKVNPILEEVRSDTAMMKEKLEGCLKYYENQDFRKMAEKFKGFFLFSSKLQEIIGIIFEKKERIDSLFFEIEGSGNVDKSIERIRKQGVKQAKKIIYNDNKNVNLCDRIMEKVTHAINDMASKGLNLFHKLLGARNLISRIRKILNDAHRRLTIKEIRQFSEIFREVLDETAKFQEFVDQFDAESDFVTAQLREKIHLCRQQLITKKRAVGQMQNIFISTVINETIDVLHNSHSLSKALTQPHIPYQQYNHLLEAIADAMLDETSRTITQGLTKQNRIAFARLEEQLQKINRSLKRHSQGFIIDTEDGQVASMECAKLTKVYKDKIKQLVKKHEDTLRHLQSPVRQMRLPTQERDQELIFLNKLVNISEVVNKREWHHQIIEEKGFHQLREAVAISATQVEQTQIILKEFQSNFAEIKKLNSQSPLKQLIREIRTQNTLYLQSYYLLEMFKVVSRTSEKNIIQNLGQMKSINFKRSNELEQSSNYKQSKAYRFVVDRLHCLMLVKGLKKTAIKEIDDPKQLMFPQNEFQQKQMENQVKYRSLILETLAEEAYLAKNKLKSTISVMKDLINSKILIDKLRRNQKGEYVALTAVLSNFSMQLFKLCLLKPKVQGLSSEARKIVLQLCKCLKNKSMNIDILEGELDVQSSEAALRVRKQFIHYKNLNENALKICQELSKTQGNDPLDTLSNVIHTIAEYLHLTNQPVYLALNQWKQPVWIGPPSSGKTGIASLIELDGYPRGTFVDSYCHEAPKIYDEKKIKTIKPTSPPKNEEATEIPRKSASNIIVKVKSHPKQSMDEEILAIQSDKQLNEEMNEDIPNEEMASEIAQDNDMGEQIIEDNEMGEQIGDEDMQQNMDEQIDEESKVNLPRVQLKQQILSQSKSREEKKIEKKQIQTSVYEVIPFFRELQQIHNLFQQLYQTESLFWKENIDFQQIEDYYHRKEDVRDRSNFIKALQNCFSMFLGSRFGPKLAEAIKGLDKFKAIKGLFLSLGEKNWNRLFEVLAITQRNYSILIDHKSEVKQIFSYAGDSRQFKRQSCKKCIYDFLQRTFKSSFFNAEQFDYDGYIGTCLKADIEELVNEDGVSFHYIVRYRAKCDESLPEDDLDSKLRQIKEIENRFEHQIFTGINIELTCLQLWVKAIASNSEDCYKPDYTVLDGYIKQLSKVQHKESIVHYQKDFRDHMLHIKSRVKSHKSIVDNLLFKVDNTNILDCIGQLANLYANASLSKVAIRRKNNQLISIWISREQKQTIMNETQVSQLIYELFSSFKASSPSNEVKEEKIIDTVESICKKDKKSVEQMTYLMASLNILEIQHFYINKPEFLFKKNQEELILTILKSLGIKTIQQIRYDELLKDIFTINKRQHSTELIVNKNISHDAFTERCVRQTTEKLREIQAQLSKLSQDFRKKMKEIDMAELLADCLVNRTSENVLLNTISQYGEKLLQLQKLKLQNINVKQSNLLLYVHTFIAASDKVSSQIDQAISQISPMQIDFKNAKDITSQLQRMDKLFSEIRLWAKAVGFSKQLTTYIIVSEQKQYTLNLQFALSLDERQRSKQYLQSLLKRCWLPTEGWKSTWNFVFEKYIAKKIKIQIGAGGISCIYYNLQAAIKKILEDARSQLAEASDVIEFVKHFNIQRFNHLIQASELANKLHMQISQRLQLKQQLVQFKAIICGNRFTAIQDFQIIKSLLNCLEDELDITRQQLDSIISQTNALKGKQIRLQQIIDWYRTLAHAKLGCHYYELRSSTGTPIALLPQSKLDKDKSKNHEEISALLKDIKIQTEFSTKFEKGVHVVELKSEVINCFIRDTEKYLSSDKQIKDFQPEVAQGQMLVLMIQQDDGQSIPLWISTLQLSAKVSISITDNRSTGLISCGIWRIGIQDYQDIKKQNIQDKDEENRILKKKLRGLASPQEKIKDVRIGQQIFFDSVGEWLKQEVKKHQNRVQERQRAEQERLRLLELQRKEQEAFLNSIEEELRKENIIAMKISLAEIKQKSLEISQSNFQIEGFYKKLASKTIKIIEKLEENKPLQEVSRLDLIKRAYINIIQTKLALNYQIQLRIRDKAELKFAVILKDREQQRKQKKLEKAKKRAQEKAQKEAEEKAKKELLKAQNKIQDNVLNIPNNIPEPQLHVQVPLQGLQQQVQSGVQSASLSEEEIKEVDIIQILMQRKEVNNQKLEAFLMEWLECQEPKDGDYYRCLLDEFCQLNPVQIEGMSELK